MTTQPTPPETPKKAQTPLELYAHDAASLLPLLRARLPHSLGILGCVLANPPAGPKDAGAEEEVEGADEAVRTVHASFPPSAIPADGDDDWLVCVALSVNQQLYIFHAAEARLNVEGTRDEGRGRKDISNGDGDRDTDDEKEKEDVAAAVLRMRDMYPALQYLGALNTRWGAAVRAALGEPDRGDNTVYLSPEGSADGGFCADDVDLRGLVLDAGKPGDEDIVARESKYHQAPYIRARLLAGHFTAIRPTGEGYVPPVAWILTHANGSLGALHTMPSFRRRGLARAVTAHRIRESTTYRNFVYVEVGNTASEAMWERRGWSRAWEVTWVALR